MAEVNESGFPLQGHAVVSGINVDIENKRGSVRSGVDKDGHEWHTDMKYDYGYICGTKGHDKEHIDVYVGDNPESSRVFVVHQNDPVTGKYDEDKVMLGFNTPEEAKDAYLSQYDRTGFFGDMAETTIDNFKSELMQNADGCKPDMSLGKWVSQPDAAPVGDPSAPILEPGAEFPVIQEPAPDGQPQEMEPYAGLSDLDIAEKMTTGEIDQIVATDKCLLVPMRITGTGITERTMKDANGITIKYPIDRPADVFLSDRFLQMCNGLPVAFYHPKGTNGFASLNYENWKEYVVGTIFYPFIKGSEVWGVAKIFDLSMLDAFRDGIMSTSPFVTSRNEIGDSVYVEQLEDINHVAIVPAGHWDTDQPAITANKEIQYKEDLMADPKDTATDDKPDANLSQIAPAAQAEPPKADADPVQAPATDDQPAEDARMKAVEDAIVSINAGIGELKATIDKLVATDQAVHAGADDPVVGEDEEKKAEAVNALTEMADSAHAEVKIIKPVPMSKESVPEYKRRIIAHNVALVDPEYAGLAKVKADSAIEPLLDKGIASIGVNAKKKSDELYRSASTNKNARVALKNGVECIPNF